MIMLFWQRLSLVLLAPMMSGMKDSQFFGHSRFKICKLITKIRQLEYFFVVNKVKRKGVLVLRNVSSNRHILKWGLNQSVIDKNVVVYR